MEYARQFDGIQAGYALNAGKLLVQYCSQAKELPSNEQYEGTLAVCILQSLLTQCVELLKYMESEPIQREYFDQIINEGSSVWGLKTSFIVEDTFPGALTLGRLLEHLRNAVSHPSPDKDFQYRPTGYTTTVDHSTRISAYRFTDSPWVKMGERHYHGSLPIPTEKGAIGRITEFHREYQVEEYLDVLPLPDGTFELARHGTLYWPILEIEIPLPTLIHLAKSLANQLAQHKDDDWDKRSIRELVA
jgi:hypothetical protein